MIEKLIQLIANPSGGVARDTSVTAGNTVYVDTNGITIPAIAVNDVTTSDVVVAFSEKDQSYYAVAGSTPQLLEEQTTELERSRPVFIEVGELPYLIIIRRDERYAEEIQQITFNVELSRFEYGLSSPLQQNYSDLYFVESPDDGQLVQERTILRYWNSTDGEVEDEFTNPEVDLVRRMGAKPFASGKTSVAFIARLGNRNLVQGAIRGIAIKNTGSNESDTESYTGTPVTTYSYFPEENGVSQQVDLDFINISTPGLLGGDSPVQMIQGISLFGDFGRNEDYYIVISPGLARTTATWLPDGLTLVLVGTGNVLIDQLKATTIDALASQNYTFTGSGMSYTFNSSNDSDGNMDIISNTRGPTSPTGQFQFELTASTDKPFSRDFSANVVSYEADFDPNTFALNGGSYSFSETIVDDSSASWNLNRTYRQPFGSVNFFLNESVTNTITINRTYSRDYTESYSFNDTYSYGPYSSPIKGIGNASFSTTGTASEIVTGSHTEPSRFDSQDAMNLSTASQIFAIPTTINEEDITFFVDNRTEIVRGAILRAGNEDAFSVTPRTVVGTNTNSIDWALFRTYALAEKEVLVARYAISGNFNHTSRRVFRPGLRQIDCFITCRDTLAFDNNVTLTGYDFYETNDTTIFVDNPWGFDFLGYGPLRIDEMFLGEIELHALYTKTEVDTINSLQFQYPGGVAESKRTVTNFSVGGEVIYINEETDEVITMNDDNTLAGGFTGTISIDEPNEEITLANTRFFDMIGAISNIASIPTAWTEGETITYLTGGGFTNVSLDSIDGTAPRKTLSDFIGKQFYIHRLGTLYTTTLTTVSPGVTQGSFTAVFSIDESKVMESSAFFNRNRTEKMAVTVENIAAAFAASKEFDSALERRMALKNKKIYLAYRELNDASPGEDIAYVHQFNINDDGNITFTGEIETQTNEDFPEEAKRDGFWRQFVP